MTQRHARIAASILGLAPLLLGGIPARAQAGPARVVKDVSDEMLAWKSDGTKLYQELPAVLLETLRECEPLRERPADRPSPASDYKPWQELKAGLGPAGE